MPPTPENACQIYVPPREPALELALADELTTDPALAQVLVRRGLRDAEAARRFLFPGALDLSPPADIPDLAAGAELLAAACRRPGARIFVSGDYDVDGICATALLTIVLRRLGADVEYYIPNRLTEGYDLTPRTVARAVAAGAQTLVTVDCGSRAHDAVAAAREAGLDVVVTDHHRLDETLPPANALVTPQRLPAGHPARGLSGAGVAYKLAVELVRATAIDFNPAHLLPLVALGVVCDVVDLTAENRPLAAAGLAAFPGPLFPGLQALAASANLAAGPATSWQLAFVYGPRLNAAGRLGHAEYALELLLAEDAARAAKLARELERCNAERRALEGEVLASAFPAAAAQVEAGRRAIVVAGEGWHPGVIGIVASRLVEKFYRPAVLVALDGETGRGSCRSIPTLDIHEVLEALRGHLNRFGGHRLAAGFDIDRGALDAFAAGVEELCAARLKDDDLTPKVEVDGALPLGAVTAAAAADLALLEPVGQGNATPLFYARARVADESQRVFKNAHLEVYAAAGPARLRGIGFGLAPKGATLPAGDYDLVFTPYVETRGGAEKIGLKLRRIVAAPAPATGPWPKIIDRRGAAWDELVAAYGGTAVALYRLGDGPPAPPPWTAIGYDELPAATARYDTIIVAAPPFHPQRLAILAAAAAEVVFAFGERESAAARAFLGRYYPDRGFLDEVYRTLRGGGPVGEGAAWRRALAIFEELGLAERRDGKWTAAAASGGRRPLADAALFRRCQLLRKDAEGFVAELGRWPEAALRALTLDLVSPVKTLDSGAPFA